jgi:hypothetical protein
MAAAVMTGIRLLASGTNMINGELFNVDAEGRGSVEDGTVSVEWEVGEAPDGYSTYCISLTTSFGTSPVFAIERNGGMNLFSLSGGNYRLYRVLDFGPYGSYDLRAEIRTSGDQMTAKGLTVGEVHLPPVKDAPKSVTEVMYPAGVGEVRSMMQTALVGEDGNEIPASITAVYSLLSKDEDDWTRSVPPVQIRRSLLTHVKLDGAKLSLVYATVIEGVDDEVEFPSTPAFETDR